MPEVWLRQPPAESPRDTQRLTGLPAVTPSPESGPPAAGPDARQSARVYIPVCYHLLPFWDTFIIVEHVSRCACDPSPAGRQHATPTPIATGGSRRQPAATTPGDGLRRRPRQRGLARISLSFERTARRPSGRTGQVAPTGHASVAPADWQRRLLPLSAASFDDSGASHPATRSVL
jgi:hypothetical protein